MNIFIYDWLGYPIFGLNKENFKKILFFLKNMKLYNTMSRSIEEFVPINPEKV